MSESRAPARMRHSWEARCRMVRLMLDGVAPADAARVCGASRATAYRLLARFAAGGWDALRDRPPIAKHCPWRLSIAAEQQILELRARTGWGPAWLAALLGRPPSTIWRVLKRGGVSRRAAQPRPDAQRYEYAEPGGLIHLDIKRLGRFWQPGKRVLGTDVGNRSRHAGWQYLHVMIDDHSRLAHAIVLPTVSPRLPTSAPRAPRLACRARHPRRARAHRQRQRLSLLRLCRSDQKRRTQAPANTTTTPSDERQGRGPDRHLATRMGLRPHLALKRRPRTRTTWLSPLVQHTPTPRIPQRPTHQPNLTSSGVLQLAAPCAPRWGRAHAARAHEVSTCCWGRARSGCTASATSSRPGTAPSRPRRRPSRR